MKRVVLLLVISLVFILIFPLVSASIIIQQNPNALYNLGNTISVPVKITSLTESGEVFTINLICNGAEIEIHKENIFIAAGGEAERNPPIPLIKNFIGDSKGTCRIRYSFGSEAKLSNEFIISDLINTNIISQEKDFAPEQQITIEGEAKKENGEFVNGFIEMELSQEDESANIFSSNTVKNGQFSLTFSVPKETKSGQYLLKINTYEKDSKGEITNKGFVNYNIFITQVPTNLEVFFENSNLKPDTFLRVKAVLHDQSGQSISSTANIIVKNDNGKIIEEKEITTDEFLELKIPQAQAPAQWTVIASSNDIENMATFNIVAVEKILTEIVNKTLIVTNTGNVPYNHTIIVKIGEQPLNVDILLEVGELKKYSLRAPDGEYEVKVVIDGKNSISGNVLLTGKAIDIKESGLLFENNNIIWILLIIFLAFFGLKLFKKWHKRRFFGYIPSGSERGRIENKKETIQLKKSSIITRNKAELELSIKGDQQDISLVCLRIKNIDRLKESKTDYENVLQNIVNLAEEQKAYIYGAQENIFFIYAPIKTKTFRNERTAIDLAEKTMNIINTYNKLAKEKIIAGVSVNHGTIVANSEQNVLKFMSMGTLMNSSKKLASLSDGEALLSETIRSKLGSEVKTQKKDVSGTTAYTVREVRSDEKSQEFIRRFMDRLQK